jgi:colicin import membrane protein
MSSERLVHIKLELWKDGTRSSKILAKSTITIGRSATCDFQIDDPSISREHLRIQVKDGELIAIDLGSSNGSLLNRSRLVPNKPTPIPEGALIRPGTAKIKLSATLTEVRNLDDVDLELENITSALESLAKNGVDKIRQIQERESRLHQSIRAKQDKLVDLVERVEANVIKKEEIEAALKKLEPRLERAQTLLLQQEPRLRKFWRVRKRQLKFFNTRKNVLFELGGKIDELEINIENHGLTEKRDALKNEIKLLEESLKSLRDLESKTRADVESQLKLLELRKQTEQAELQLTRARLQKDIEEVEARKTAVSSDLRQFENDLHITTKQLADVREHLESELAATENVEQKKESLAMMIDELQSASHKLTEKIDDLEVEKTELTGKVSAKKEELRELEDFIVNRLAETDERCREMEKSSHEELNRQLEETSETARRFLTEELSSRRREFEAEFESRNKVLQDREDNLDSMIAQRMEAVEGALKKKTEETDERLANEEREKKRALELALQEERLRHERKVQDLEQESIRRQERQLERTLRSLASNALTAAALHIKSTTPNAANLLASSELEDEVYQSLKQTLDPNKNNKDSTPILARAHDLSDRERRFWIRAAVGIAAGISIITSLILNPRWPGEVWSSTLTYFEESESGSDYFAKRLKEIEANRPKFLPEQDRRYKDTYTDNILYTEGFYLVKSDPVIRKEWTLKLNQFLINEFEVDEDVVVRFLPIESRLITELAELVPQISPNFVNDGIERLRTAEQSFQIEIQSVLGGPENYKKFWAFQGQFYKDAISKVVPDRVPASTKNGDSP